MSTLLDNLCKLIKVKTIVTLGLTGTFMYLSVKGVISEDQFMLIFTTVIAFYFGTQTNK